MQRLIILYDDIDKPDDTLMTQYQFSILVQSSELFVVSQAAWRRPWCARHDIFFISSYFIIPDPVLVRLRHILYCDAIIKEPVTLLRTILFRDRYAIMKYRMNYVNK